MAPVTRGTTKNDAVEAVNVYLCEGIKSSRIRKKSTINNGMSSYPLLNACRADNHFRDTVKDFVNKRNDLKSRIILSEKEIAHYEQRLSLFKENLLLLKRELSELTDISEDLEELNDPIINDFFNNQKEFSVESLRELYDEN